MRCFAPSTKSQTIDLKIGGGGGEVEVLEAEKSYVAKLASGGALASKSQNHRITNGLLFFRLLYQNPDGML